MISRLSHSPVKANASARAMAVLGVALLSTGCSSLGFMDPRSWWGDDDVNVPVDLVAIEQEVNLNRKWSVTVGNGQGDNYTEITPIIEGDRLYVASENGTVIGVDKASGETLWRSRLEETITGGVGAGSGMVFVATQEAEIVALDAADGEPKWRSRVSSEVLSPALTDGDVVIAQTIDGKLVALEFETGEQRWTYETTLPALTLRGTSTPIITTGGSVVAGFSNGTIVSVNAEDGVFRWEERVAVPEGRYDIDRVIDIDGDLFLDGTTVLASSYQGNLMALDVPSGRIVWGTEASSYHGMDIGFGNIYYSSDQSHLIAVRRNSEDQVWANEDLTYRSITAPKAIGNYVAVADFEGYVHLVSQIDGRIVGRSRLDNDGIRANLLAEGDTLYVYGNSGRLLALTLQ